MKTINLLPKREQKEIRLGFLFNYLKNFWLVVIISLLIVFLLALALKIYLAATIKQTQQAIAQAQNLLASSDNQKVQNEVLALNDDINTIKNLRLQHYYWSNALEELANLMPADFEINILTFDRATGKVDLTGTAKNRPSIIDFWGAMHKTDYFRQINFPLTNLEKANDVPFTFTFYLNVRRLKQE